MCINNNRENEMSEQLMALHLCNLLVKFESVAQKRFNTAFICLQYFLNLFLKIFPLCRRQSLTF